MRGKGILRPGAKPKSRLADNQSGVWAAVDLLHRAGRRQDGLRLAHQVTGELEGGRIHSELASQWRLLLAFHAGQAGDTALAQRLLATLISVGPAGQQDAAAAVLRAVAGLHADTRLQIILLEDELTRTPAAAADDLLRLHQALTVNYATLGDYHQALVHGRHDLALRHRIHPRDHPGALMGIDHLVAVGGRGWSAEPPAGEHCRAPGLES
jgi:hypothetical protein